jgi:hypothetical protein
MDKVVKLKGNTIERLEKFRTHIRQTWDEIINKILDGVTIK